MTQQFIFLINPINENKDNQEQKVISLLHNIILIDICKGNDVLFFNSETHPNIFNNVENVKDITIHQVKMCLTEYLTEIIVSKSEKLDNEIKKEKIQTQMLRLFDLDNDQEKLNLFEVMTEEDYHKSGHISSKVMDTLVKRLRENEEREKLWQNMIQKSNTLPTGLNIHYIKEGKQFHKIAKNLNRRTCISLYMNRGRQSWNSMLFALHMIYPNIKQEMKELEQAAKRNVGLHHIANLTVLPFPYIYDVKNDLSHRGLPRYKKVMNMSKKVAKEYDLKHIVHMNKYKPFKENVKKAKTITSVKEYCYWFNQYWKWLDDKLTQPTMNNECQNLFDNGYDIPEFYKVTENTIQTSEEYLFHEYQVAFNNWLSMHSEWIKFINDMGLDLHKSPILFKVNENNEVEIILDKEEYLRFNH